MEPVVFQIVNHGYSFGATIADLRILLDFISANGGECVIKTKDTNGTDYDTLELTRCNGIISSGNTGTRH